MFFPRGTPRQPNNSAILQNTQQRQFERCRICQEHGVSAASLGPESKSVFAKTLRSVERRPALLATTYPILYALEFKGVETGAIEVDLKRFGRVMTAITQALHFRDLRVKVRKSRIFSPSLQSDETLRGQTDSSEPLRIRLATLRYRYLPYQLLDPGSSRTVSQCSQKSVISIGWCSTMPSL